MCLVIEVREILQVARLAQIFDCEPLDNLKKWVGERMRPWAYNVLTFRFAFSGGASPPSARSLTFVAAVTSSNTPPSFPLPFVFPCASAGSSGTLNSASPAPRRTELPSSAAFCRFSGAGAGASLLLLVVCLTSLIKNAGGRRGMGSSGGGARADAVCGTTAARSTCMRKLRPLALAPTSAGERSAKMTISVVSGASVVV